MTPEEKAKELIKKFTEPTQQWNEIERVWEDSLDNAKECAIIAVDEIIEALDSFGYSGCMYDRFEDGKITTTDVENPTDYFNKVKEHINKL